MQQLATREEVKALPLQTLFEDAVRGQDTAFGHADEDTFEFAKRRARTATQKLVDGKGLRFSGRVRVLTDPSTLTITYCQTGTAHPAAPEARRRVERKAAVAGTGVVIETRKVQGGSKAVGRAHRPSEFIMEDETLVKGEIIYGCQPGCAQSVGPVAEPGDDIRCAHCKRTNKSALKEFSAILRPLVDEDGQEVLPAPTIQALFEVEDDLHIVRITQATIGRKTRKEMREGDLGDAITEAADKARKVRAKRGRDSLARRRGRK